MKLITRDTDYALRAVCFIAKSGNKVVTATELVSKLKVPKPFLRKLLQSLAREGVLVSHKGLGGGFSLAMPADKIFLLDIATIFQGKLKLNECFLKKLPCPHTGACPLRNKINNIEKYVLSQLKQITVSSLLKGR